MTYTVSHVRPDRTAEIVSADRHSPATASIKVALHLSSAAKVADAAPARVFGQALLTEYTRVNAALPKDADPVGAELEYDGHVYRIDDSAFPPNICPCCGTLVRPKDHAFAGDPDAYCLGCYPWGRNVTACLPANSAHTEAPES